MRAPLFLVMLLAGGVPAWSAETALDRYVAAPDASYKYNLVQTLPGTGYTTYVLDMTSQTWRSPAEVNRPEWRHWLTVIKPDQVKHSTGFLFITGGSNQNKRPAQPPANLTSMAVDTGTVVAELRMVPNQPLIFAGESAGRTEDSLIAYTWDKFLRGGDENWPARLPMTKSAVRAMDTVTSFCASDQAGKAKVDRFVVAGASKRGWTTWATAAVDKRVAAIIPMVIDLLNVEPSFQHHWRAYGFWAPAIDDYADLKIMDWMGSREYPKLLAIEDPFSYRERFTMPKYIVNASGDQFFLPDSSQFYFDDLKGEKYLRYVPNADHSMRGTDAAENVQAFYESFLQGGSRPKIAWEMRKDGSIQVKASGQPVAVKLWQATNPKARDFRLDTIGPAWKDTELKPLKAGEWSAKVRKPSSGWTAFFVELTYPGVGKHPLKFTTAVRVIPDTLPFPPYVPDLKVRGAGSQP
ncbi:MAG TPA: PhoPQ-activated pathogenicity-related family protein [Bryobacteraceae bacterium]|nr:PhoPQ-activated pathogenicity-related family protein [Bryobacteraceae bacterium]